MNAPVASGQDYNYVPGWANTHNHRHRGSEERSELPGEAALMARLKAQSATASCVIDGIEQSDRNVLVNRYRSNERRHGEARAFSMAEAMVIEHVRRLQAGGRCRDRR